MDLNEIKKIVEADGGKFIFIENGKPSYVFMSFEEYKKKLVSLSSHKTEGAVNSENNGSLPAKLASAEFQVPKTSEYGEGGEIGNIDFKKGNSEKSEDAEEDLTLDDLPI